MIINLDRRSYSTDDWVLVKTYEPDTSFGPLPLVDAKSYVATRGGESAGFYIVENKR